MGVAWELRHHPLRSQAKFLLAHQDQENSKMATATLQRTLTQVQHPLDLWLVNFHAPVELDECVADSQSFPHVDGYDYQLYHCKSE